MRTQNSFVYLNERMTLHIYIVREALTFHSIRLRLSFTRILQHDRDIVFSSVHLNNIADISFGSMSPAARDNLLRKLQMTYGAG